MKKLILSCALMVAALVSHGQGRVNFANTSGTVVTADNTANGGSIANISGAGNYYFGLYLGPDNNNLSLALLATNTAIAGRFNGGNPAPLPSPTYSAGTTYAFQVRGWSSSGGDLSYEAAVIRAAGSPTMLVGVSGFGTVTPTASPGTPGALFGAGPGQVGGFVLAPVPEPSSIALGLLGLGAIALFRRRK